MNQYQLRQKHVIDQLIAAWFDPREGSQQAVADSLIRYKVLFEEEEYARLQRWLARHPRPANWQRCNTRTLLFLQKEMRQALSEIEHHCSSELDATKLVRALLIIGQVLLQRGQA